MDADPPVFAPGTDQEQVAWIAVARGESSLAVVDDTGRFLGFVPARRLLTVCCRNTSRTWPDSEASCTRAARLGRQVLQLAFIAPNRSAVATVWKLRTSRRPSRCGR
jgi:hypothetical protein